jgi:hypothetical protein
VTGVATETAPVTVATGRPRSAVDVWARLGSPGAIAVLTLVALPVLVYAVPAIAGRPVAPGDDLTQSLPLRELVGAQLRAGHLPVFDPYIWGGTPLLGGWNAGAAYPLTWLFAVVPASAAWTITLTSAVVVAGTGCYAFLRACRLGVLASWLGGVAFAFGGGMSAQVPHVGLVIGMSWVPLGLLSVLRLTGQENAGWQRRAAWTCLLAGAVGLVELAGEPRAVSNGATVLGIYAAWRLWRLWRLARGAPAARGGGLPARPVAAALGCVGVGAALGVGIGAVQLLPGLAAVATSQRATVTSYLFSAGSLPARWLLLLAVPNLLGGAGSLGQPRFFASYNLTEVTGYLGVLPLVAAGGLLGGLRRHRPLPEWLVWHLVALAGILLALGSNTPLWHVLVRIPLFGGQRLQSRSILVTDLALAVLLAYWAEQWVSGGGRDARRQKILGSVGPACVGAVVVAALGWRTALLRWMGVSGHTAAAAGGLGPSLVPFLVLAVVAAALVWAGPSLGRRRRATAVVTFVLIDLVVLALTTVVAVGAAVPAGVGTAAPAVRSAQGGGSVVPVATLHLDGRFAVYDPAQLSPVRLRELGVPDTNAVVGTYSVEGYGSIVDRRYADATGTHRVSGTGQDVFTPRAADDGVFDELDTTTILAPSACLVAAVERSGAAGGGATAGDRRTVRPGDDGTWYLGTPVAVTSVTVKSVAVRSVAVRSVAVTSAGAPGGSSQPSGLASSARSRGIRVGLVTADGSVEWAADVTALPGGSAGAGAGAGAGAVGPGAVGPGAVGAAAAGTTGGAGGWRATWPHGRRAVAVVVSTRRPAVLDPPVVTTAGGGRLSPDGALDAALVPPHWTYAGHDGPFAVFRNRKAAAPLTLRPLPGRSLAGAAVKARLGPPLDPLAATVTSPGGVELVRAVADIPGWHATWRPAGSRSAVPLPIEDHGVVQMVTVPEGAGTVTWAYVAPELGTGEVLSGASLAAVLLLLGAIAVTGRPLRSRRRRPEAGRSGPQAGPPPVRSPDGPRP